MSIHTSDVLDDNIAMLLTTNGKSADEQGPKEGKLYHDNQYKKTMQDC